MQFTLVSTIYNEASRLKQTISDLEAQTLKPTEIIITDAGSKDGSIEILEEWKKNSAIIITILIEKGCNVARGRNLAIEKAQTEWIVSTDFGCRFHSEWLQTLLSPLLNPKTYNLDTNNLSTSSPNDLLTYSPNDLTVVGGAFTIIEDDITTLAGKSDYILQRGYPVVMDDYFSVSSRSIAYKKEVWEKVGGYPEWLTLAADDTIYWKLIKKHGFNYSFVKEPLVYWGRHKTNKAFAKEAFRYGLGDGESRINYRNFWSNLIETGLRYLFFLSLLFWVILSISYILNTNDLSTYQPNYQWIYWSIGLLTLISSLGLRSYINTYKSWQLVKSNKYYFKAFMNALWQLELSRYQYLKGYIKGLRDKDQKKKEGREQLWQDLTTESHGGNTK